MGSRASQQSNDGGGRQPGAGEDSGDERQITQIDRAASSAGRAARLTDQLLGFSRPHDHQQKPADLSELVRSLDALLEAMFGGAKVRAHYLENRPLPIRVDAGHFELAMPALARRAASSMQAGGTTTIQTRSSVGPDGKPSALLGVSDAGFGDVDTLSRNLLGPFFSNPADGGAWGLGLSIVRRFAEQSGAQIVVDTAESGVPRMTIIWPCYEG